MICWWKFLFEIVGLFVYGEVMFGFGEVLFVYVFGEVLGCFVDFLVEVCVVFDEVWYLFVVQFEQVFVDQYLVVVGW